MDSCYLIWFKIGATVVNVVKILIIITMIRRSIDWTTTSEWWLPLVVIY